MQGDSILESVPVEPDTREKRYLDLAYSDEVDCSRRRIDLYLPTGTELPVPLVVWIHGGGWHSCDRRVTDLANAFLNRGWALASLGYRLTSQGAPFPAQFEDCAMALRWLSDQAGIHGIDCKRMALVGHSAGAHLGALLLLAQSQFIGSVKLPGQLDIKAAALWSVPFDLSRERGKWPKHTFAWAEENPFCQTFFPEGRYDESFARWASPASYLPGELPPIFIYHCRDDDVVPFDQAKAFAQAARDSGGEVTFTRGSGMGHRMLPGIGNESAAFFEKHL